MYFLRNLPADISRYLPQFLQTDEHFKGLLSACSTEHEKYRLLLDELSNQLYVQTATWRCSRTQPTTTSSGGTASCSTCRGGK